MAGKKRKEKPDRPAKGKKPAAGQTAGEGKKHPEQKRAEKEEMRTLHQSKQESGDDHAEALRQESDSADAGPGSETANRQGKEKASKAYPVVGIGASAGGLEALEAVFGKLPTDSGMASVVITHTDPKHTRLLPRIIQRKTELAVRQVEDGMQVAPDIVYLPPSDRDAYIERETFRLKQRPARDEIHMPVDFF